MEKLNFDMKVYKPKKFMSKDFLMTGNGIHSSSPNAHHTSQCTKAHNPVAPSGKCSVTNSEDSNIYKFKLFVY